MNPAATTALMLLALGLGTLIPARRVAAQLTPVPTPAAGTMRLTLDDAVTLAMKQGYVTRLASARLASAEAHEHGAAASLLPQLSVTGNHLRSSGRTSIVVPRGALGDESSGSPLPAADRRFDQGAATLTYMQIAITQPVTQLWRIRQAQQLASAQRMGAAAERARDEADVRLAIERLYASVLIARAHAHAAEAAVRATRRRSMDVAQAVASGIEVPVRGLGAAAEALDAEYAQTTAEDSTSDAEAELRSALAVPPGTRIELVVPEVPAEQLSALDVYVARAESASPEVASARATLEQAKRAVGIARAEFIPDVGVGLTLTTLDGVSFVPRRAVGMTIEGSWTLWDWGRRGSQTRERIADEQAAAIGLALARDRVTVDVERAYRAATRAERGAEVARAAFEARQAALRMVRDREVRGLSAGSVLAAAEAELAASEARVIAAELRVRHRPRGAGARDRWMIAVRAMALHERMACGIFRQRRCRGRSFSSLLTMKSTSLAVAALISLAIAVAGSGLQAQPAVASGSAKPLRSAPSVAHPLDPLDRGEIAAAVKIIQASDRFPTGCALSDRRSEGAAEGRGPRLPARRSVSPRGVRRRLRSRNEQDVRSGRGPEGFVGFVMARECLACSRAFSSRSCRAPPRS